LKRCAHVPEVLNTFNCELETVRFLRLGAGARIREHRDHKLAIEDGVARVHIPVVTNPKVEFFLDDTRLEMLSGEAWYLNFNLKHRVENNSTDDRVHLVIDCIVNDWFLSLFPKV
jgi:quercetin dioxygenase-like cupin family protein